VIMTIDRLISKREAIRRGMMQELLSGKTRLPGFTREWQRMRLSELLSYEQPTSFVVRSSKQLVRGRTPVLTAGKTFVLGFTNETDGIYDSIPVIIFDDFTTASKFVTFEFKVKSSAMKILSARPGANLRFAFERMQLIEYPLRDHKRYWISEYSHQEIAVPDEQEQEAIAAVITDADDEMKALRERLTKARAVKQGMMQELLTGRKRLLAKGEVA
jgi:type I restriction enzyme, S subunit